MAPRYRVTLTEQERSELEAMTKRGVSHAKRVIYARALLLVDTGPAGPSWSTENTIKALGIGERSLDHLKQRFVEGGISAALERKLREKPPREVKFDGTFEARLLALACSDAPEGHRRWTIRLLAEKVVELDYTDFVSPMSIQRTLKKTNFSLTAANTGKFPQKEARRS